MEHEKEGVAGYGETAATEVKGTFVPSAAQ